MKNFSPRKPSPHQSAVQVREEWLTLPTCEPAPPDKNPMFLETRISGSVTRGVLTCGFGWQARSLT